MRRSPPRKTLLEQSCSRRLGSKLFKGACHADRIPTETANSLKPTVNESPFSSGIGLLCSRINYLPVWHCTQSSNGTLLSSYPPNVSERIVVLPALGWHSAVGGCVANPFRLRRRWLSVSCLKRKGSRLKSFFSYRQLFPPFE